MGTGFAKQKKQAKLLQEQVKQMQTQLKSSEFLGQAGAGLVEIVLSGDHELKRISIKRECVDPEDVEGLEDLIREAYAQAAKQIEDLPTPKMPW